VRLRISLIPAVLVGLEDKTKATMNKKYVWLGVGVIAIASYLLYNNSKKKSFTSIEPEWATSPERFGVPINIINK